MLRTFRVNAFLWVKWSSTSYTDWVPPPPGRCCPPCQPQTLHTRSLSCWSVQDGSQNSDPFSYKVWMEVQRKKINPVSFCLVMISAVKLSEITAASLNWQGREILKNIQKTGMVKGSNDYLYSMAISRSTADYTFCLCLACCLHLLILVTINIPSKGFLSFTAKSSSPILFPIRCQVLPSGVLESSGFPGA